MRRFIDPRARFPLHRESRDSPLARGEIGFDMPGAEVGHEAGRLLDRDADPAGRASKIPPCSASPRSSHRIDLKDDRSEHPETAGFEQIAGGAAGSTPADDDRIERGLDLFDALYAAPSSRACVPRGAPRRRA